MGWYGLVTITWSYLARPSEPNMVELARPNQDSHILLMTTSSRTVARSYLKLDSHCLSLLCIILLHSGVSPQLSFLSFPFFNFLLETPPLLTEEILGLPKGWPTSIPVWITQHWHNRPPVSTRINIYDRNGKIYLLEVDTTLIFSLIFFRLPVPTVSGRESNKQLDEKLARPNGILTVRTSATPRSQWVSCSFDMSIGILFRQPWIRVLSYLGCKW